MPVGAGQFALMGNVSKKARTNPPGFLLSVSVDNFVDKYRLSYGALWISLWISIVPVGLTLTNGMGIVTRRISPPA